MSNFTSKTQTSEALGNQKDQGFLDKNAQPASHSYTDSQQNEQRSLVFYDKKERPHEIVIPAIPVADTHTHVNPARGMDTHQLLQEAKKCGVELVVCPLDPAEDAQQAAKVLAQLEQAIQAIPNFTFKILAGSHPYHAAQFSHAHEAFDLLCASPLCAGIGEIGLDYTCDVPKEVQWSVFEEQLSYATTNNLVCELHIRDVREDARAQAHRDALAIMQEVGIPQAGCVLHCFTQGPAVMYPFVELGCYVAFGGALTFKKSDEIREAALEVPNHLLLSETDAPYMTPEPLRGIPCRPALVTLTVHCMAQHFEQAGKMTVQETFETLWKNAQKLFLPHTN